jgi:hypothetical protein
MQHLQGDGAVVLEVAGEIDGSHAAAPELTLEQVAVAESLRKVRRDVNHAAALQKGNEGNLFATRGDR